MLTKIEIDGFKTFKDFQVELAPFQVIVGPNGSGKSNLFDALQLLSRLADKDLATAFQELRGNAGELFTKYPGGKTSDKIRIAVEMLVDRKVEDDLGGKTELKYTRLRYEVEITLHAEPTPVALQISYEALSVIAYENDSWCRRHHIIPGSRWMPEISTNTIEFIGVVPIKRGMVAESTPVYEQETYKRVSERKASILQLALFNEETHEITKSFSPKLLKRTLLSSINSIEYPYILAVRKKLLTINFLHPNPDALRQPSPTTGPFSLDRVGNNLPTMLARMQAEDKFALNGVSIWIANLAPGMHKISLQKDSVRNMYDIWAETTDHTILSAQVLSEGTLRLLALAALYNDPQLKGTFCLEEVENGVHPGSMGKLASILYATATDLKDPEQADEPLRQVLVTTHSPLLISQLEMRGALLFTFTTTRLQKDKPSFSITRMVPILTSDQPEENQDKALKAYCIDMIRGYLHSDTLQEAEELLKKAKFSLYEG